MENGDLKINFDRWCGLPETMNAWPIYLGDYLTRGEITMHDALGLFLDKLSQEMAPQQNLEQSVDTYLEFNKIWTQFASVASPGNITWFETTAFREMPDLAIMVEKRRATK